MMPTPASIECLGGKGRSNFSNPILYFQDGFAVPEDEEGIPPPAEEY